MASFFSTCTLETIAPADVAPRINALDAHDLLTFVGRDLAALREMLARAPDLARRVLFLELGTTTTADGVVTRILDDLADLAVATWPEWRPTASRLPWRRAAEKLAAAGVPPRFRRVAREIELAHLMEVLGAGDLVLVGGIDPVRVGNASAAIAALEWATRQGAAVVALLASCPTPYAPYDRVLSGAIEIAAEPLPAAARALAPSRRGPKGSVTEQRVREALRRDDELGPLFDSEVTLSLDALGPTPRVDLCWRAGRVVVELDGPEHYGDPIYGRDRHRDYELLVAGYLVLRLTNAQVQTDLPLAIEKIRRVVRLRQPGERHP